MRALSFLIVAIVSLSSHASGAASVPLYVAGTDLTNQCRAFLQVRRSGNAQSSQQAWDAAQCYGYVTGIIDHFQVMEALDALPVDTGDRFCIADSVSALDATEVVANYLDANPEKRSLGGYFLVRAALSQKYPCK